MSDIASVASRGNGQTRPRRPRVTGQTAPSNKPRIKVGLLDDAGKLTSTPVFEGRDTWALDHLIRAGKRGCTPIDNPAPRWSHYVWKLRQAGVIIETHDEPHGGPYAGHHARYELRSKLVVIENCLSREDA